MRRFKLLVGTALVAVVVSLAACSGGPGGGGSNDPAGVVNSAIAAAESGGFAKLADYSCAANKDDLAKAFGGGGDMSQLEAAGINVDDIFSAMSVDFQDVTATETNKTATEATVHVKGKIAIKVDAAKMRDFVKKILAMQSIEASDAMIDAALSGMSSQLETTQDLDDDVHLIQEDGKWVVCD
jgi:hypothetical protein